MIINGREVEPVPLEMTPERKKRMEDVTMELFAILRAKTQGPAEALAITAYLLDALQKYCGGRLEGIVDMKSELPS